MSVINTWGFPQQHGSKCFGDRTIPTLKGKNWIWRGLSRDGENLADAKLLPQGLPLAQETARTAGMSPAGGDIASSPSTDGT